MRLAVNLSTAPFVNRLPQWLLLGSLVAAALGLSTWNIARIVHGILESRSVETERAALRTERQDLQQRVDALQKRLSAVDLAPLESRAAAANDVLAQKALSWSILLERLEELLPWNAALESVRTSVGRDGTRLTLEVRAKSQEEALSFIDTLEASDCFQDVYPTAERKNVQNQIEMTLEALHDPWCGDAPQLPGGLTLRGAGRARGGRRG
jgi:Tfp pilus assembly protein PilN